MSLKNPSKHQLLHSPFTIQQPNPSYYIRTSSLAFGLLQISICEFKTWQIQRHRSSNFLGKNALLQKAFPGLFQLKMSSDSDSSNTSEQAKASYYIDMLISTSSTTGDTSQMLSGTNSKVNEILALSDDEREKYV
jgi:hypothetical protein